MRFIDNAIEAQLNSRNIKESNSAMEISCRICTSRGLNIPCDRCKVQICHEQLVSAFIDLNRKEKENK